MIDLLALIFGKKKKCKHVMLTWCFGPTISLRSLIVYQLPDSKKVPVSIGFTDAAGNPAPVDGVPAWSVSDSTKLTLDVAADGMSAFVIAVGPLGTSQVQVSADADMGAGVTTIQGILDVEVVSGPAVNVVLNPGDSVDK